MFVAALMPTAALAQESKPTPVCVKAEIVPGFEAFGRPAAGPLAIGMAMPLPLERVNVAPPVQGPRPFRPGSYTGHTLLTISEAGTYRIALSRGAWLSVFRAAGEARSTTHDHGPACSGIAKIVSFDLEPGIWHLAVSEAKGPDMTVMVVRASPS